MKTRNNLSRLLSGSARIAGQNTSRLPSSKNIVTGVDAGKEAGTNRPLVPGNQHELRPLSLFAKKSLAGINFGTPTGSGTYAAGSDANGTNWTNLIKQSTSGNGLAGVLGGGLANLGGIGSIISGIAGLFGGGGNKNVSPALSHFQLPKSQEQTIYVSSHGSMSNQGSIVGETATNNNAVSTFQNVGQAQGVYPGLDAQWFLDNRDHIAQAVKNAMLHSSSINDIVSEI